MNFFKNTTNKLKNLFSLDNSNNNVYNIKSATSSNQNKDVVELKSKSNKSENNSKNVGNNLKITEKKTENKSENNINAYTSTHLSESVVKKARDYMANGWTFHSNSKGTCTWGRNKYKHVCSTWSYNVLWLLWFPKVSKSTEVDLKWKILPKMGLKYIWEVDPDHPEKNWYKPQDWDTAVWPRFNGTQHQATYIAGHWVSDTIQNKMSCYSSKNEPNVKIYRYTW